MIPGPVSSVTLAATGTAFAKGGQLFGAVLTAAGDTATAIIYDNTAGSGTVVLKLATAANTTTAFTLPNGITLANGAHAVLTGTTPSLTLYGG
jgi:hypothetical protein